MNEPSDDMSYHTMYHNEWITLTENGPWPQEMNGSIDVLTNYYIKKHGIKNQMDDFEWA